MHITRRRLLATAGSAALAPAVVRATGDEPVMSSTVVDWTALTSEATAFGLVRQVFKAPTATLIELECHVSTLNPGLSSHAPHRHPNEEMIIVQQGTVEVFSEGSRTRVGPGSVDLPRVESSARSDECGRHTGDVSRDQLEVGRHPEGDGRPRIDDRSGPSG